MDKMNVYDTKQVKCSSCGKFMGELQIGSSVIFPLCKKCDKKEKRTIRRGIRKILVPIDISIKTKRALDVAIYLSKHLGSSITLLYSKPNITVGLTSVVSKTMEALIKDADEAILQAKKYCEKKNIVANHKITHGEEAEEIIKTAKKSGYDLIVMGSSGKGALREILFGSISNYVLHNSNIPVLTVKEGSAKLDTKIQLKGKAKKKLLRHGSGVSFSKMKKKAGL